MKALSLYPFWAWAVANSGKWPSSHPGKLVENRSRYTNYRGDLVICAGKRFNRGEIEASIASVRDAGLFGGRCPEPPDLNVLSAIRGSAVAVVHIDSCSRNTGGAWEVDGQFGWHFSNVRPLQTLVPVRGQLGIFNLANKDAAAVTCQL